MFEIEYKGANSVIITTKTSKLIVDPKLSIVGLKDIPTKDAVELATESRFATNSEDAIIVINSPGEYGVAGFHIHGIPAQRHLDRPDEPKMSTMYRIEIGDTRIGLIGNIYEKLTDEQLEDLGVLDILILPVGGNGYTLDAVGAAGLVHAIDPKVVIPVHYADSALKYEVPQAELQQFISELGVPVETVSRYKFKPVAAPLTTLSVVEITRS